MIEPSSREDAKLIELIKVRMLLALAANSTATYNAFFNIVDTTAIAAIYV